MQNVKLTVLGNSGGGKSSLLIAYTQKEFHDVESQPRFSTDSRNIIVYGTPVTLTLQEINSQAPLDDQIANHSDSDVFILCFGLDDPDEFRKSVPFWARNLGLHCPDKPVFLCGTKKDIAQTGADIEVAELVEEVEREFRQRDIDYQKYVTLSAKQDIDDQDMSSIETLFVDACQAVLSKRPLAAAGNQPAAAGGFRVRRPDCSCDCTCEIDWKDVLNQTWQVLAFLVALGAYTLVDVFALYIAYSKWDTKDACWDELEGFWLDPREFLIIGGIVSLGAVALGMFVKVTCGVDEEKQDAPRLCFLVFFFVWAIMGYILVAQINAIDECSKQSIGRMILGWSLVKNIEFCCGSLDIVVNGYKFHFMN